MTIFVGLLVATAAIAMAGFGVTMLLVRHRLTIWEHCALACLFGTATVSLCLWIGGFLLRGVPLQVTVTCLCVALGVLGFRRWLTFPKAQRTVSKKRAEIVFIA